MYHLTRILKSTDLIVTRAGASTLAEITALGVPSILVPSPYVSENHQYKNAMTLVNNGAGVLLDEKDFNKDNLVKLIDELLSDKKRLANMKKNALSLSTPNSCDVIYGEIKKLIGE